MLTEEQFIKFIGAIQEFNESLDNISKVLFGNKHYGCLSESKLCTNAYFIMDIFIDSHFTEEGSDLVYWWLYEDVPKIIYEPENLFEGEREINVEDVEDLWKYLNSNKEIYLK